MSSVPHDGQLLSPQGDSGFLIAQYGALRSEILLLMQGNESRTFTAFGFASTIWAAMAALLGSGHRVPGTAFLLPIPVLILAFNTHVVFSRRVANLGSFLGASSRYHFGEIGDWETEVGRFAHASQIRMSSRVPLAETYWLLLGVAAALAIGVAAVSQRPFGWRVTDIALSVLLTTLMSWAQWQVQKGYQDYASARKQFDTYWAGRFRKSVPETS